MDPIEIFKFKSMLNLTNEIFRNSVTLRVTVEPKCSTNRKPFNNAIST